MSPKRLRQEPSARIEGYDSIVSGLVDLLETARRVTARSANAIMTATYWEIGRRIVKSEQRREKRAEYGEALLRKLASDLTARFGRGFGVANLAHMRKFFLTWPEEKILQTPSARFPGSPNSFSEPFAIGKESLPANGVTNKMRETSRSAVRVAPSVKNPGITHM
jgi:hypothetical protein